MGLVINRRGLRYFSANLELATMEHGTHSFSHLGLSSPPIPLRDRKEDLTRPPLLSSGVAGRRGRGCATWDVQSRSRPSFIFP
jgi:hypothetical protein